MVVVYAPREVSAGVLGRVIDVTAARMAMYTGCRESGRYASST
jgi:hypothetical protein